LCIGAIIAWLRAQNCDASLAFEGVHMKTRRWIRRGSDSVLVAILVSIAITSTAFAINIDFTDGSWNGAQGLSSFTTHASGIDLFATAGVLTVNYVGGPSGDNSGNDGLGINDDEITQGGVERLRITFATPVTLNSVQITDLFLAEGPTGQPEVGKYSLNGGRLQLSLQGEASMVP
jgi:hypothetical protein